jgi:hypothetical protein
MTITLALALFVMTATDESETAALIARLGAPRAADRDAASAALEARGRAVLPALRAASSDSRDAEVRSRAARVLAKVEHDLLTRPTMVTLDMRDRTIGEAIKGLGAQNRFNAFGDLDNLSDNLRRKINLREEKPCSLLSALDRLCAAGGMRWAWDDGSPDDQPMAPLRLQFSQLTLRRARVTGPTSDSGAFRVKVVRISSSSRRTRVFEREEDDEHHGVDEDLSVDLHVIGEPRLMFVLAGMSEELEAIDDQGRSRIEPQGDFKVCHNLSHGVPNFWFPHTIRLKREDWPGGTLKRFRGAFPVQVAQLMGEPIVVPLAGSEGHSFGGPDATLTIQSVQLDPTRAELSIKLILRTKTEDLDVPAPIVDAVQQVPPGQLPPFRQVVIGRKPSVAHWGGFLRSQFFLTDDRGREIYHWNAEFQRRGPREALATFRYNQIEEGHPTESPNTLFFYSLIRTTAEIPFEFHDIPLP